MSTFGVDIEESHICILKKGATKHEALEALIEILCPSPAITDCGAFRRAVFEREAVMSTGIGGGIAIPHVRIPEVTQITVGLGIAPEGVDYGTLDNQPVHILVLFATPKSAEKEYLRLLARVMTSLRNRDFFERLTACRTPSEVYGVITA